MSWSFALFTLGTVVALSCQFGLIWFANRPPGVTFTHRLPWVIVTEMCVWSAVAFNFLGCYIGTMSVFLLEATPDPSGITNNVEATKAPKWSAIFGGTVGFTGLFLITSIVFLYLWGNGWRHGLGLSPRCTHDDGHDCGIAGCADPKLVDGGAGSPAA